MTKDKLRQRNNSEYLMWLIIAVVFVLLMVVGTFFDYDISKWMTKNSLRSGEYYSRSVFALVVEAVGSFPIWLALCFAFALLFLLVKQDKMPVWAKTLFGLCLFAAGVFAVYMLFTDICKYLTEQNGVEYLAKLPSIIIVKIVLALLIAFLIFLLTKNIKADRKKLFGLAMVILCAAALYFIVTLIKTPFGRVRFRTINVIGDQSLYTPWYVISGSRSFDFLPEDCCKSFPSGHTFSAGLVFILLSLPRVFKEAETKKAKIMLWAVSVAYTLTVALGRIIAGAHYLTDVTVGGFLAFVGALTFRSIFLDNCLANQKMQNNY